tara:strand:- start:131 stop:760 length:630 start_codon:yes stop_codon:yes gene_type:complete
MMKKKAIEVFNGWAQNGKDEGMKKNHFESYLHIKKIIKKEFKKKLSITVADIGCGNGWAAADLLTESFITKAYGYDGAESMIKKAAENHQNITFYKTNLNNWTPNQQFDIIYSMEAVYYLKDPQRFIKECYKKWLKPNGLFIAGIDHYKENKKSLSWPAELNVSMQTKTVNEWRQILKNNQFINCSTKQVNQKKGWAGTLIFWGRKNAL